METFLPLSPTDPHSILTVAIPPDSPMHHSPRLVQSYITLYAGLVPFSTDYELFLQNKGHFGWKVSFHHPESPCRSYDRRPDAGQTQSL